MQYPNLLWVDRVDGCPGIEKEGRFQRHRQHRTKDSGATDGDIAPWYRQAGTSRPARHGVGEARCFPINLYGGLVTDLENKAVS